MSTDLRMLLRIYDNASTDAQQNDAFMSTLRSLVVDVTRLSGPAPAKDYGWAFSKEDAQ